MIMSKSVLNKTTKILIAVMVVILIATAVGIGVYFGLKTDEIDLPSKYTDISQIHDSRVPFNDIYVKGKVLALSESSFIISDGTGYILYYTDTYPTVEIGDTLEIFGDTSLYGTSNTQQFSKDSATFTIKNFDIKTDNLVPVNWSSYDVDRYSAGIGKYITIDLELYKSNNYINANLLTSSSKKRISIIPPTRDVLGDITLSNDPVKVSVTGYVCYCMKDKYVYLLAQSIKQIGSNNNKNEDGTYTLSLDATFGGNDLTSYNDGNYGGYTYKNIDFEYYRAYKDSSCIIKLMPLDTIIGYETLQGCLYNTEPIFGIDSIDITYKSYANGYIYTGDDRVNEMTRHTLDAASVGTTVTVDVDDDNFFVITCNDSDLYIISLSINYTAVEREYDTSKHKSGEGTYRANPVTYEGELVSGESSINVPTQVDYVDGEYIVITSKIYTYYSYSAVEDDPSLADEAAMTDPIDVIIYYQAFGVFPANYVAKQFDDGVTPTNFSEVKQIFGDDTRYVSRYNRTSGYVQFVPYSKHENSRPYYYEFDIALVASYWENGSRGVGRVVAWEDGWSGEGYDHSVVAVYTDDHYITFQEYLNTGYFGPRFDAESLMTNTLWTSPLVVEITAE